MRSHDNALLTAASGTIEPGLRWSKPPSDNAPRPQRTPPPVVRFRPGQRSRVRVEVERTLRLAEHLPDHERALIRLIYEAGRPIREVGAAMNLHPRKVHSRIRRILRRIDSDLFRFVLRARSNWADDVREVARLIVLEGLTHRAAADAAGRSLHFIRQSMATIRFLHRRSIERRSGSTISVSTANAPETGNDLDHD